MKKGFTIIEVVIVFALIFAVAFFVIPIAMNDTQQAKYIELWQESYNKTEYMFNVLNAQMDDDLLKQFKNDSDEVRSERFLSMIKEQIRVKRSISTEEYTPIYKNNTTITEKDFYKFDKIYLSEDGRIIGYKWLSNSDIARPLAIMMFDVNGLEKPNTWGKDIFGIDIFADKVVPLGKGLDMDLLKNNCSKMGNGVYCSYYYLFGGEFD